MIQSFKDAISNSIVLKAFLGLMIIAFGVWGVGDVVQPGMDPNIAISVKKTDIAAEALQRHFTNSMNRVRESMGKQADTDEMRRQVIDSNIEELSRGAVTEMAARDIGLAVSDAQIKDAIRSINGFKDETGKFNQMVYAQTLRDNRLTEREFVDLIRIDVFRNTLFTPTHDNATAPAPLVETLAAYRGETRAAETLLVNAADLPAPAAPDEAALKKTYDDNVAAFTAPEYRKVTAVVLHATDLVAPESIADEQIQAYYDENIDRYRDHEKRSISQIVFESKEQADAARNAMAPGDHLAEIAKKAKADAPIDLGSLRREDPLVKMIGAAYDLPKGEVSQPVQSDLGWHLFEVNEIVPEKTVPLDQVKDQIRKAVAEDKGTDALYDASTVLDDGLAGGVPVEELAERVGGKVVKIEAVDRQGRDQQEKTATGLLDTKRFLETAFGTKEGGTSKLLDIPEGYYALHVDKVIPATPKAFESVRKDVLALWEKEARAKAAADIAAKLNAEASSSTSLASLATKYKGVSYAMLGPITRFGDGLTTQHIIDTKRVSPALLDKLFTAKTGDVVIADVTGGAVIARLRDIMQPADSPDAADMRAKMASLVKESVANDLSESMYRAIANRYPVQVNQKAVDSIVGTAR